jgi:hypothetical protein
LQHCLAFLSPRGTKELELITDLVQPDEDDDGNLMFMCLCIFAILLPFSLLVSQ